MADVFKEILTKAEAAGVSMNEICREAKVNRSTPQRWAADPEAATVGKLERLRVACEKLVARRVRNMERAGIIAKQPRA